MSDAQIKVSFLLPAASADWAGQALALEFPDGLLSSPSQNSLTPFSGWPRRRDAKSLAALKAQLHSMGATRIRVSQSKAHDYVHEYKSRFPMQRLGRFVILPEWRRKAKLKPGELPIVLLQGQAFGTGLHESTRLMLKAISSLKPGKSVLDLGAGSGILGFAALRLGWGKVFSVEIEEAACEELRLNRVLNGFSPSRFAVRCGEFPKAMKGNKASAELVLANLVTPLLCALMRPIAAQAAKGATLLFSGIHTEAEAKKVASSARAAGLTVTGRSSLKEWWCLRACK